MTDDIGDAPTAILAPTPDQDSVYVLNFGPDMLLELANLSQTKASYDVVILNASESGFWFPAEVVFEAAQQAKRLLTIGGCMVFVKADKAMAIVKESLTGLLNMQIFDTHAELYDYSPSLAHHVQMALGNANEAVIEATDLSEQVLMSSTPVLTVFGIKLKAGMEAGSKRNLVIGLIDNYTPLSAIVQKLVGQGKLSHEELIDELKSLEQMKAIFPLFNRVPFLVHCFRHQIPFKLKDYLIASGLITQDELDELVFEHQSMRGKPRLKMGALCVSKGYLSARQLEIALQDQAFYGQGGESEKVKLVTATDESAQVRSLVGHLGTTDPAGLLQSLATNRETGVLSVEYKDRQFRAVFEQGRLSHAKLGHIKGNEAVIEFVSAWSEGVFVFIQRQAPPDLAAEECQLTKPIDKLLLDSALAQDKLNVVWKKLPKAGNSSLEKNSDKDNLLSSSRLVDPQDKSLLTEKEVNHMNKLWKALDGLTPLANVIGNIGCLLTWEAAVAVDRLLYYKLISIPAADVTVSLAKFQKIASAIGEKLGIERNIALLRLSLQAVQGYSVKARMFFISTIGEIGLDIAAARSAGAALSAVVKDIEDWQVKYIEYVSQEIDRQILRDIVYKVHSNS